MFRAPVLFSLTLLVTCGALRVMAQAPPPVAAAAVDLDGDGQAERVTVSAAGQVTVAGGGPAGPVGASLGGPVQRARIEAQQAGGQRYLVVRAQGAGQRLLVATLGPGGALQVVYNGPVGPLGRDGERALQVVLGPSGVVRYQTAPGVVRCDGEQRLFAERYEAGSWRPLALLPDLAGAERLRATEKLPAGPRPWPAYRMVAASDQAGSERRADRLAPPLELVDGRPQTVWQVPAAQGAWLTARADAGHEVRGLSVVPAPGGPPPPAAVALLFGPGPGGAAHSPYVIELVPRSRAPQWVVLPQAVPAACVSLVVLESPGAEVALGEVGIVNEPGAAPPPAPAAQQAPVPGLDPDKCPEGPALQEKLAALRGAIGRPDDLRGAALVQDLAAAGGRCPDDLRAQIADALVKTWGEAQGEAFVQRYRILQGLGQLGSATQAVTGLLREVLAAQDDPVLRAAAAQAAAGLRGAQDQVDLVLRALADRDPGVRQAALSDVSLPAQQDQRLLAAVERVLDRDPWPMVRQAAAQARAALCTPLSAAQGRPPVPALRQALRDRDQGVRRQGLLAVARCEGAGAAPVLAQVARDEREPPSLRAQACALLARLAQSSLGSAAAEPVLRQVLSSVLEDPAADERSAALAQAALRGLGLVGGGGSVPVLLDSLHEPQSPILRWEAAQALGEVCARTGDKRIASALSRQDADPDARVRAAIERARARCRYTESP